MSESLKAPGPAVAPANVQTKAPPIPPREPQGDADWKVTARHSPLKLKSLVVKAKGREQAWQKFLAEAEAKTTPEAFKADGKEVGPIRYREAMAWLAEAKKANPDILAGVEVIGAEYSRKRVEALRIKGTVTQEQIGFPELASA